MTRGDPDAAIIFSPSVHKKAMPQAAAPRATTVVIVDPISTGACIAVEALNRGYSVIALWTAGLPTELKSFVPAKLAGLTYAVSLDQSGTLAETANAVRAVATGGMIDAVIVGAETGVLLADSLSEHMGLATNGTQTGDRRDKHVQQLALRAVDGLRATDEAHGTEWAHVEEWVQRQPLPIVLKPCDSAGSDGVKLCHSVKEAKEHFAVLMAAQRRLGSQGSAVLCQEFLRGDEYVVDCVSSNGHHKIMMVWRYDKRPCNDAAFVYFGMAPVPSATPLAQELIAYVKRVLDALGIRHGATHGEVIMTADGPCLVEMNCRSHGAEGSWMPLASALTGSYCQVDALLDAYVAPEAFAALPDEPLPFKAAGQEVLIVSMHEGKLVGTPGFDTAKSLESFVSMESFVTIGERIEKTIDVFTQPASIIVVHTDPQVVARDVERLRALELDGMFLLDKRQSLPAESPASPGPQLGRPSARRKVRPARPPPMMAFSSPFVGSAARYSRYARAA